MLFYNPASRGEAWSCDLKLLASEMELGKFFLNVWGRIRGRNGYRGRAWGMCSDISYTQSLEGAFRGYDLHHNQNFLHFQIYSSFLYFSFSILGLVNVSLFCLLYSLIVGHRNYMPSTPQDSHSSETHQFHFYKLQNHFQKPSTASERHRNVDWKVRRET